MATNIYDQFMDDLITTRCIVWVDFNQCCLLFSSCRCLCEAAVIVRWMTAFFALQVSLHSGIYYLVRLHFVGAWKEFLLNSFTFFLLSVTNASSVLSGYRLCFDISPFNFCRSIHGLRSSFLRSISLHALSHLSTLQYFVNSVICVLVCYLVVVWSIIWSGLFLDSLSSLVALGYQFRYIVCPVGPYGCTYVLLPRVMDCLAAPLMTSHTLR